MVRYFYAWIPAVVLGTICILSLPWLGLIALAVVVFGVVVPLAWALVYLPYMLVRAIGRSRHSRDDTYRTPQLARSTNLVSVGRRDGAPAYPIF